MLVEMSFEGESERHEAGADVGLVWFQGGLGALGFVMNAQAYFVLGTRYCTIQYIQYNAPYLPRHGRTGTYIGSYVTDYSHQATACGHQWQRWLQVHSEVDRY